GARPGKFTLAIAAALLTAAIPFVAGRGRSLALFPLAAAAILTSDRGHSGTSGHWWAPVTDSIHLLAAAAWIGALVHLVLVALRGRAGEVPVRRYSQLALPTVLVVLASGVLTAFGEFRSVSAAFHTGYGQTLVVKGGIVL